MPLRTNNTRKRYNILAMVFISAVINYLDRRNLAVAAFEHSDDLGLNSVQMGLVFSAFVWTYTALQIPGGMVADKIKTRLLYTVSCPFDPLLPCSRAWFIPSLHLLALVPVLAF